MGHVLFSDDMEEESWVAKVSDPIIRVRNLNFFYGETPVLKNISMEIPRHKVTALIGPSGCGKSTLLRTFNRIYSLYTDHHATGEVLIDGYNILGEMENLGQLRAHVGMVFQKPTPFPMSIYDNIAFGVRLHENLKRADMAERIEWALRKAALWHEVKDKLKRPGLMLSGGQQQRLCIARTLAIKPSVILLDEPTSALDPVSTHKIEEVIAELKKEFTIVIVTHNLQQANRIADYTGFMFMGQLVEFSETDRFFNEPRSKRAKAYVGGSFG